MIPAPPRRVLVVDDDEGLNRLVQKTLSRAGFQAEGCLTGAEAVRRAAAEPDMLLLLDQKLPDMDGTDLVRTLAEQDVRVPFIAVTGHGDEKTAVEMMKLGARDYLVKDVELMDSLPRILRRIFRELETEKQLALAERALQKSEAELSAIYENAPLVMMLVDRERRVIKLNAQALTMSRRTVDEAVGMRGGEALRCVHAADDLAGCGFSKTCEVCGVRNSILETFRTGKTIYRREASIFYDHTEGPVLLHILVSSRLLKELEDRALVCLEDISDRIQAEEEKAGLLAQFHQAQKMESVGRLAGGVAHDLNNLLVPILGYSEILLEDAPASAPRRGALEQMVNAGMKARDLVRRLLAFSRRQALEFRQIDLNRLLENFEKLLRRTIREDITVHIEQAASLPPVRGDAGQLEQVIMNLAVNAQDAMPDGGELTIITGQNRIGRRCAPEHQGIRPGAYTVLTVSDTGRGIDAETRKHLFEPFFTTKEKDKGTGLGLATVYGIVKQHGGHIRVSGEPGEGAVFSVYLPESEDASVENTLTENKETDNSGSETVLLAEDNEQVRNLTSTILKREGYRVLEAAGGREALEILERHEGRVHLLLTDVIMPGINGRQLYEKIAAEHPDIRVLYMSGYTDDVIAGRGMSDEGVHFIEKPFTAKALKAKMREVLEQ